MGCPNTAFVVGNVLVALFTLSAVGLTPLATVFTGASGGALPFLLAEIALIVSFLVLCMRQCMFCTPRILASGTVPSLCDRPFRWKGLRLQVALIAMQTLAMVLLIVGLSVSGAYYASLDCSSGPNYYYNNADCWTVQDAGPLTTAFGVPSLMCAAVSVALLLWMSCPCCVAAQQDANYTTQKTLEARIELEVVARVRTQLATMQQMDQQAYRQQQASLAPVMMAVPLQMKDCAPQVATIYEHAPQWPAQPSLPLVYSASVVAPHSAALTQERLETAWSHTDPSLARGHG